MRATQPSALNDPFECSITTGVSRDEKDDELLADVLSQIHGTAPVTLSDVKSARADYGSLYARHLLTQQLSQRFGIVAFASSPFHPLMWSHYTVDGSGFVIGYSTRMLLDIAEDRSRLVKVRYRSQVPRISSYKTLLRQENEIFEIFAHKSNRWRHEEEWRLIVELKDTVGVGERDEKDQPINLLRIPNEAVEHVFHTERTPPGIVQRIDQRLLEPNNRYSTRKSNKLVTSLEHYSYQLDDSHLGP